MKPDVDALAATIRGLEPTDRLRLITVLGLTDPYAIDVRRLARVLEVELAPDLRKVGIYLAPEVCAVALAMAYRRGVAKVPA